MMKKNKLFVIAFAALGVFYSCDDAIDIRQPGEVNDPDLVYNSVSDLENGVDGVYAVFSTESTIEFTSIFTDEVAIGINNGGQGLNDGLYNFQLQAGSDAPQAIWQSNYTMINFANRIIKASERVLANLDATEDKTTNEYIDLWERYNNAMGQLYGMRAFAYLQLETYFSTNMADDSALGVMLLDFVPSDDYTTFLPRSTNAEIFALIDADLAKAVEYFAINTAPDNYRVGTRFINAVKARMAIYREKYSDALTHIAALNATPLSPSATIYFQNLLEEADNEYIFQLGRKNGEFGIGAYWNSQESSITGSPFFEVSRSLYNAYDDGDYRKGDGLVDETSRIAPNYATVDNYRIRDVLVVNKYPGNAAESGNLINDIKVFPNGEMWMLRAEAYAGLGQLNGATNSVAAMIRQVERSRHNNQQQPLPVYSTAEEAWADILLERRKELAFFGFRYTDIKRLGVKAGNKGIERYSRDCEQYGSCTLAPTDHRFTMPIPTSELIANPNIRGQQNPGY